MGDVAGGKTNVCPRTVSDGPHMCTVHACACVSLCGLMWCVMCVGVVCVWNSVSSGQRTKKSDGERSDGVSDCSPGEDLGFYSDNCQQDLN